VKIPRRLTDKGIVSLAARSDCPLMWSHYGDQHKGLCIGYSVPDRAAEGLHKVSYGGSRLIAASAVAAMLHGDDAARRHVDEAVLTRKAAAWRYEREWRSSGRGAQSSPLELEEIVFGMRCSRAARYVIVTALAKRWRPVRFYEIRERPGRFLLGKYALDTDEMLPFPPRRSLDIWDEFGPIIEEAREANGKAASPLDHLDPR
jgi:hypothetical protein